MINPIISQTKKSQPGLDRQATIQDHATQNRQNRTTGTQGVRKVRRRSGCFDRSTSTPSDTSTKANSVPIWKGPPGTDIENTGRDSHEKPAIKVLTCGVRYRYGLWRMLAAAGGRATSRTRRAPDPTGKPSSELIMPIKAPRVTHRWTL